MTLPWEHKMRSVGLSDLDMAARALLVQPKACWASEARALIEAAHCADIWRKRTGSAHPSGGTGSLYSQAALGRPNGLVSCDSLYCEALGAVLDALKGWRARDSG